jgi:23S rRNA (cytosine1962-C5)-methyltransferase
MAIVVLQPGRERSLKRRHPWVFSGAVASVEGAPSSGDTVDIEAADRAWVGRGAYSPQSQIAVRVWTFDAGAQVDSAFFRRRLEQSIAARRRLTEGMPRGACRLVYAESDGLPGLIVDRYADFLVCQFLSAGAERWKSQIVSELAALHPARGIYDRSDVETRAKEGLSPESGVLSGEEPPDLIEIEESGLRFLVDVKRGQKTGFYLDQRENRRLLAGYANGAEVLNCFAYTGSFGVTALSAGAAKVANVDSSSEALDLAARNVTLNGMDASRVESLTGDVPSVLRRFRDSRRQFDLIILDPPKFAEARSHVPGASRAYKDINLLAFKLLRPGGVLFTFSCSGNLETSLFQKIVSDAALDARREAQIVRRLSQADDHPTSLGFPEGTYLKGFVCRVD